VPQAKIVSLHHSSSEAEEEANKLQQVLDKAHEIVSNNPEKSVRDGIERLLELHNIPFWARSVRFEKDGFRKWAVLASEKEKGDLT